MKSLQCPSLTALLLVGEKKSPTEFPPRSAHSRFRAQPWTKHPEREDAKRDRAEGIRCSNPYTRCQVSVRHRLRQTHSGQPSRRAFAFGLYSRIEVSLDRTKLFTTEAQSAQRRPAFADMP